ncbi:MAG: hypothetical protein IJ336_01185 [Lachnospiraceae bacterium]|nr:hypothetical protein [Lachnospiraceae bacterium]
MRKKGLLFTLVIGIMLFCGCVGSTSFIDAENYNQFSPIYMFSSNESIIAERIPAEKLAGSTIRRDILAGNTEKCLVNDWACDAPLGQGICYNDFYLYDYKSGELEILNLGEKFIDNTVYMGTMNDSKVILLDAIGGILHVYDLSTEELKEKKETDLNLPAGVSLQSVVQIACDEEFIYLTFGIDENELCVFDYDLNLLFHKTAEEYWKLCPNIRESCLICHGDSEFYHYTENELKDAEYNFSLTGEGLSSNTYFYPGDRVYDFYYVSEPVKDSNGVVILDSQFIGVKGGKAYKIMDLAQMGMDGEMVYPIIAQGNGNYIIGYYNVNEERIEYYLYEKTK